MAGGSGFCDCKSWDKLFKDLIFGKAVARKPFLGFMTMDYKLCSVRFDLQGIPNGMVDISLNHNEISMVFHCDGLVLCVTKYHENEKVMAWTEPIRNFKTTDKYALGYNSKGNHKMLKFFYCQQAVFEIHDFSSYSWRVLSITRDWSIPHHQLGVFLKGNAYFVVKDVRIRYSEVAERFGQLLPLSFHSYTYGYPVTMTMSCVREEHFAAQPIPTKQFTSLEKNVSNL
ncbi:LOW QUALITY PROTEIN: hypothetical protein HID58_018895 [Brassica napus]|uniref:F-box associated beta-propeller type 1 domain-containing protein n=1 Tax=Brassica napus TaxID=3708 RepID=A0ABQ8DB89_BRANA|nr:LOW QUALITY PROTEIN: hypothetical protein HID58_018895 [Brassica napus]